jgi:protein disulfide-isomerase-like protein
VVVGSTFEEMVLNSEKHVLAEFYAPWCGHCKKLEPIYEQLAAKMAVHDDLIIVKMDATKNEVKGLELEGFPTIRLYKIGEKNEPI